MAELGPTLPGIARRAIADFVAGRPAAAISAAGPAAAVFVTLRQADGALRGCIGSLRPVEADVARETARVAVLASYQDPRFLPVGAAELPALAIEVSVLSPEEPVADPSQLDPEVYGVIVRDGSGRQALLLPGIPGIDDATTQLILARRKAGIADDAPIRISRFRVQKWSEGPRG